MTKLTGVPIQVIPALVKTGTTEMFAYTGTIPVLMAVNDGILPVPLAPKPIDVLLLVQKKTVPVTGPEKLITGVEAPLHTVRFGTVFTVGTGLTVIVNVLGVPVQVTPALVKVGVTVMVATAAVEPVLVAINDGIFPVPLAASPIDVLLFVQLNTVPGTVPVKLTAAVGEPLHRTWFGTAFTLGIGFIISVTTFEKEVPQAFDILTRKVLPL